MGRKRHHHEPSRRAADPSREPEPSAPATPAKQGDHPSRFSKPKWGTVVVVALTLAATIAAPFIWDTWSSWFHRPKLEIWFSSSVVAQLGEQTGGSVRDSVLLVDVPHNCIVDYFEGVGPDLRLSPPTAFLVEKLYLHNSGHSPITNLILGIRWNVPGSINAEGTPNIFVRSERSSTNSGLDMQKLVVGALPPGSGAVVTASVTLPSSAFSYSAAGPDGKPKILSWEQQPTATTLLFLGADELFSDQDLFKPMSAARALEYESELYGNGNIHIPTGMTLGEKSAVNLRQLAYPNGICDGSESSILRVAYPLTVLGKDGLRQAIVSTEQKRVPAPLPYSPSER